jgi:hypothetical protein
VIRRPVALVAVALSILVLATGCAAGTAALPDKAPTLSLGTTSVDPAQVTVVQNGGAPRVTSFTGRPNVAITGAQLRLTISGDTLPRVLSIGQYPRLSPDGTPVDGGDVVDCITSKRCDLAHDVLGYTVTLPADPTAKAVIVRAVYALDTDAAASLPEGSTVKLAVVWAMDVRRSDA